MLDNIKYLVCLKTIDKNILENNFESALNKLNFLIKEEYKPSETYLKRGRLCKKLLMLEDAYRLPRTEERITALLLARQYLKEKESENEG